ncbi:hypothetical protein D2U14_01520 [Lacticaseibacillus paracasei]|uniref:hypothetical protein n=1 Tax=Lacticaseibacillus paracasei TaxID=1597 RepID=UPI000E59C918|nr:hypothetical protein [Lacticaseibacillus paracasei]RHX74807.1 hypothetical protein D2U14_01520 [Lacticaseibacillus paracasei]
MYVVAGLNTGTEYYRAKYQSRCIRWINENMAKHKKARNTRGDDIKVDIPEPLIIKKVEEICQ